MRVRCLVLVLVLCGFSLVPLFASESSRIALVIGNASYSGGIDSLSNPTNDASDVATKLTANGWKVILVKDANRRTMISKLAEFQTLLKASSKPTALFFYAGHAVQLEGKNYLLPLNEVFENKLDVTESGFVVDRVVDALDEAKVLQSVIFLDSCRDNPFKAKTRSIGTSRGLASIPANETAEEGSAVIFSTAPNDVASDGNGRNGLFTEALLPYLDSDLELNALFRKVRDDVRKRSGGAQTPSIVTSGILTGLYIGKTNASFVTTAPVKVDSVPSILKIQFSGVQAGLTVSVDGKPVGTTPMVAEVVQGDQHQVSLQSLEWNTWTGTVSSLKSGTVTLEPKLVRSNAGQVIDLNLHRQTLLDGMNLAQQTKDLWGTVGSYSWMGAGFGALAVVGGYLYGTSLRNAYDDATADTIVSVKSQITNATLLYQTGLMLGGTGLLTGIASMLLQPDVAIMDRQIKADETRIRLLEATQ